MTLNEVAFARSPDKFYLTPRPNNNKMVALFGLIKVHVAMVPRSVAKSHWPGS